MIKTDIFRYKNCRFCKENCKLQKMHKTTHVHNLCEPSGILEDFVHKGAFSVLPVPRRHLHCARADQGGNQRCEICGGWEVAVMP